MNERRARAATTHDRCRRAGLVAAITRLGIGSLVLGLVLAGLPSIALAAVSTVTTSVPSDVGLSSGGPLVLLTGPPTSPTSGGVARSPLLSPERLGRSGTNVARARRSRRTSERRDRAQRWYARRLLDGG